MKGSITLSKEEVKEAVVLFLNEVGFDVREEHLTFPVNEIQVEYDTETERN